MSIPFSRYFETTPKVELRPGTEWVHEDGTVCLFVLCPGSLRAGWTYSLIRRSDGLPFHRDCYYAGGGPNSAITLNLIKCMLEFTGSTVSDWSIRTPYGDVPLLDVLDPKPLPELRAPVYAESSGSGIVQIAFWDACWLIARTVATGRKWGEAVYSYTRIPESIDADIVSRALGGSASDWTILTTAEAFAKLLEQVKGK